ncbi:sigma-54-dependent Fis family transcriptional regulator [Aquabacterium sp. CECT 9606]|uniref:sigma-54 interaction domain-containing protein n=1 Tax=Aquabacterium sp. CECT 9606 TaxID=2845822 RepID=UPI001E4CBB20|nr:sigma-54 dependent transcriptional regulator [Aquabacterium sp. CECT 9606]CAH0352940.1 Sigma54-dependent transcriptional activator SfnR [Aquabacterium sp. CECT 9606]
MEKVLTLPDSHAAPLSIRAKALVFHDPGSLALLSHVERIARSDATVLVIGETGTGKELIARHIHTTSGRRGPFVAVNCGAFSETLIDAELFGHESGAFTGASQARAGWFEAANGGTLFLDEIGDLPLALQVKLLRVLQERQVVRLGSRRGIALDVRLVAATNIDLARAVEAQHFRADLYYRLSVAGVRLPPLRERPADILPLARHFILGYQSRLGMEQVQLSPASQAALLSYSWPGNIRELENVIHFALIVCRDEVIEVEDLKLVPLSRSSSSPVQPVAPTAPTALSEATAGEPSIDAGTAPDHQGTVKSTPMDSLVSAWRELLASGQTDLFDKTESALIHAAYDFCHQNQVRTARVLGITRNMLRTHLKRHGLLGVQDDEPIPAHEPTEMPDLA